LLWAQRTKRDGFGKTTTTTTCLIDLEIGQAEWIEQLLRLVEIAVNDTLSFVEALQPAP